MHKALLCHYSSYSRGALTRNFKEAVEGHITLDQEDPKVFSRFNAWIYTGGFHRQEDHDENRHGISFCDILTLYEFADRRLIPSLQNQLIDALIQYFPGDHNLDYDQFISFCSTWREIPERSPLRVFLVDLFLEKMRLGEDSEGISLADYPPDFIAAIAIHAQRLRRDPGEKLMIDLRKKRCERYHVHELGDSPCADVPEYDFYPDRKD